MFDAITASNYVYYMFKKMGVFKSQDGGAFIRTPVMYALNDTAQWYSGYEQLNVTPQEGITDAIYPWAELAASVSISRAEERKNSGKSRLINLLEAKIKQAEEALILKCVTAIFGTGNYNTSQTSKQMAGLLALVPEVPGSYDAGGLDGDATWWQNKVLGDAATWSWINVSSVGTGFVKLGHIYNNCAKGPGGRPDIMVSNQYTYESYCNGLLPNVRYTADDSVLQANFENIKYRGATWSWDEECISATITKTLGLTTACIYLLNSKTFEIVYDSQSLFTHTGFVKPENQTAKTAQIVFMGNMLIRNRKKNGICVETALTDIE